MSKDFLITDNPAEGCHLRRQAIGKQDPLGVAIVKSFRSDDLDYPRYKCAKQGLASLHNRTADGLKQQAKARIERRATNKKAITADGALRDGPAFNIKECQACGAFIPRAEEVCSTCHIPANANGHHSLSAGFPKNITTVGASCASAQCAVDLLSGALVAMDPNRSYVVKEIHAQAGVGVHSKYHIEWCGFPSKSDWTWQTETKMKDKDGNWTCPRAMAEFQHRKKKK